MILLLLILTSFTVLGCISYTVCKQLDSEADYNKSLHHSINYTMRQDCNV